jgi:hypothetical protein
VVAVSMDAGRRNEAGQALEQLEGCEAKLLATVHIGLGKPVDQTSFRRRERLETGRGVEPLQGERPPGAVANEPLETRSVLALDADRAVDGSELPKRCGKEMAPSCTSRTRAGAPGLASRSADLSARTKMASTALATSGV